MTKDAAPHSSAHVTVIDEYKPHEVPVSDLYDSDDALPKNSPLLEPRRPKLKLSPSPAPTLSPSPVSPASGKKKSKRRRGPRPSQGDVILISHLDEYRRGTAAYAADLNLEWISETEDPEDPEDPEDQGDPEDLEDSGFLADSMSVRDASPEEQQVDGEKDREGPSRINGRETGTQGKAPSASTEEDMGALDLKSLAAGALAAFTEPEPDAGPTPPVTEHDVVGGRAHPAPTPPMAIHTRQTEFRKNERHPPPAAIPSPYSPHSIYSPRESGHTPSSLKMDMRSPTASIHSNSHSEGLPPIQSNSPRYESNAQTLPSIRSQLGDIPQLAGSHGVGNGMRGSHHGFPGSPPGTARLPSLHSHLASPPIPPAEPHRDHPLSPTHPLAPPTMSPRYYPQPNGLHRPHEYGHSPEASGPHQPGSPPVAPGFDRMSLDVIQTVGSYVCKVPGCSAPAFQTQYLLNSHANVHSSARPHYCPVPGCPRAEGGKGFKRKNEMIRHGLVHESPGYICPFCPDRDHRYPRPDNLQRHVRVHHVDKDKDDPLLRDVLAQRPDGPSRGRRRRGVAA